MKLIYSAGLYLVGSIVLNTVAVALFMRLTEGGKVSHGGAIAVSSIISLIVTTVLTEAFYRLVEGPTCWVSYKIFDWIRE
jgi:hypothetical protein